MMTPWYTYDHEPMRTGVYLTRVCLDPVHSRPHPWDGWSYWDGKRWAAACATARAASELRYILSGEQLREWRGVTVGPNDTANAMSNEELITLAVKHKLGRMQTGHVFRIDPSYSTRELLSFAAAVADAERERCDDMRRKN